MKSHPQPIALRVADAARAVSLSERTVWELVHRGDIPSRRVGRAVLIPVDSLQQWATGKDKEAAAKQPS